MDGVPSTDGVPSEISGGVPSADGMPSEISDGVSSADGMPSADSVPSALSRTACRPRPRLSTWTFGCM